MILRLDDAVGGRAFPGDVAVDEYSLSAICASICPLTIEIRDECRDYLDIQVNKLAFVVLHFRVCSLSWILLTTGLECLRQIMSEPARDCGSREYRT